MAYNQNKLTPAELQRIHNEFERQEENNLGQAIAESKINEELRRQEEQNLDKAIAESERNEKQRVRQERERQERRQEEAKRRQEEAKRRQEEARVRQKEEQNLAKAIEASLKLGASSSGASSSGASSSGASSSGVVSSGVGSSGIGSSGASSSGASSSGVGSSSASSSGPSSSIISEISAITTELMKSKPITMYFDTLKYLNQGIILLKIPIFVHYNNLSIYNNIMNNVKACIFNYKSENIYLVRQYIMHEDLGREDLEKKSVAEKKQIRDREKEEYKNLEFRPNAFYMKQQTSYVKGTNLYFYGKLEIYNIKTKKITIKDNVEVHSHDGTFSPPQNLLSFNELLNKDSGESGESFFYYVVFTPIDRPDRPIHIPDFPIFKGFYWLQMMPDKVIDKPCDIILSEIQTALLPLKGGNYLQLKHKSKLHKTKSHKKKSHKSKLHKTKL